MYIKDKRTHFFSILMLAIILYLASLSSYSLATELSVKPGDKFTFSDKTIREYHDNFNNEFSLELTRALRTLVQDVKEKTINYDLITQQHYYSFSFSLENGDWISSKQDGEKTTITRGLQENVTNDQFQQFIFLDGMEYPLYDPETVGAEYKNWNGSKSNQRFSYFDLVNDVALDEFDFRIEVPFFVSDSGAILQAIENQWRALALDEVERLPTLRWNVLEEGWEYPFRFKLLQNVAYKAEIAERTASGEPKIIEFTPSWIGHYWLPNDSPYWNGTDWKERNEWVASVVNPLDSGTGKLRSDFQYYSSTPLNMKRPPMIEFLNDLKMSFSENEVQIHFQVFIEDLNHYTFHDPIEWARQNRNNGTLTIDYQLRLNQPKNVLTLKIERQQYDFGVLGKFTFSTELQLVTEKAETSIISALLIGTTTLGVFVALVMFTKNKEQ